VTGIETTEADNAADPECKMDSAIILEIGTKGDPISAAVALSGMAAECEAVTTVISIAVATQIPAEGHSAVDPAVISTQ
jgi:hypothetical protein